jgi:hypothetical protein
MKATLEFNLPEEQDELDGANNGWKYRAALSELDGDLRSALKYNAFPEWDADTVNLIRTHLWEILNDRNLPLD